MDINTIYNYMHALKGAFILYRVPRYDVKGKEILKTQEKFYVSDISLIYATMGYKDRIISGVLENIVFLELKRRGYQVFVGKIDNREIDFVAAKQNDKLYIQVCYKLESQQTIDRKFSPLLSINDQYPKYVISMDDFFYERSRRSLDLFASFLGQAKKEGTNKNKNCFNKIKHVLLYLHAKINYMNIIDSIFSQKGKTAFSFELLPPLKGNGLENVFNTIDTLLEFDPKYINITTHRSELIERQSADGKTIQTAYRHRPGTVAIAATIQHKYNIPAVPHIICSGFTKEETEYALLDLQFLGIHNLLLLRGDKGKHETEFVATGHHYATDLQAQVNQFNKGLFLDASQIQGKIHPFSYGMACYPEKHAESPSLERDLEIAKLKVDNGAEYLVTQMFFDNQKYYEFLEKCREIGIDVPIIPGIKPITLKNQLTVLPKIFHTVIPEALSKELEACKNDGEAVEVGIEWCTYQAQDLIKNGVPSIHFYSLMATQSVKKIAQRVY